MTQKLGYPFVLLLVAMVIAGLACGLPAPAGVGGTIEAVSTQAYATAGAILTQAGTAQIVATELAGTVVAGAMQTLEAQATSIALEDPSAADTEAPVELCSISGNILYDYQVFAMRIYWREVGSGAVGFIETADAQTAYTITGLQPGTYNVVAWFWPQGASGAATTSGIVMADTSSAQNQCAESLMNITLQSGQQFSGADIGCWGGDYFYLVTPAAP